MGRNKWGEISRNQTSQQTQPEAGSAPGPSGSQTGFQAHPGILGERFLVTGLRTRWHLVYQLGQLWKPDSLSFIDGESEARRGGGACSGVLSCWQSWAWMQDCISLFCLCHFPTRADSFSPFPPPSLCIHLTCFMRRYATLNFVIIFIYLYECF